MKKLILLVLCLGMAAGGYASYQGTLALSSREALEAKALGIVQSFSRRDGKAVSDIVLFPAVYQDFDPETDKTGRFWDERKIAGAQDHILRVTNQREEPCYFRTFVAFENNGGVFDELITVNWADGFVVTPVEGDLTLPGDSQVYRVYLVAAAQPLAARTTTETLLQLFLSRTADNDDVSALGGLYTIRAVTEAVWLTGTAEDSAISLDLLGEPTLEHARKLFAPDTK